MFVRIWIGSGVLTVVLSALTVVAESQQGECYDGDPIPNCPNAHGLADSGYLLGALLIVSGAVFAVATLMALWAFYESRAARRR